MIEMEQIPLTPLAEHLGKLIRERGGYLPSVGGESSNGKRKQRKPVRVMLPREGRELKTK